MHGLAQRTGIHTCSSPWFWNYWGFYWGRRWRRPLWVSGPVSAGCAQWRTVLGFSFMAMFSFIVTTILVSAVCDTSLLIHLQPPPPPLLLFCSHQEVCGSSDTPRPNRAATSRVVLGTRRESATGRRRKGKWSPRVPRILSCVGASTCTDAWFYSLAWRRSRKPRSSAVPWTWDRPRRPEA